MKRITLAVIFILLVTLLVYGEYSYVEKTVKKFTDDLSKIETALENGDYETALNISQKCDDSWKDNSRKMDMLLYHDYVDNVGDSFVSIRKYIEFDNEKEALLVCEKAKRQLQTLFESEKPLAENII